MAMHGLCATWELSVLEGALEAHEQWQSRAHQYLSLGAQGSAGVEGEAESPGIGSLVMTVREARRLVRDAGALIVDLRGAAQEVQGVVDKATAWANASRQRIVEFAFKHGSSPAVSGDSLLLNIGSALFQTINHANSYVDAELREFGSLRLHPHPTRHNPRRFLSFSACLPLCTSDIRSTHHQRQAAPRRTVAPSCA